MRRTQGGPVGGSIAASPLITSAPKTSSVDDDWGASGAWGDDEDIATAGFSDSAGSGTCDLGAVSSLIANVGALSVSEPNVCALAEPATAAAAAWDDTVQPLSAEDAYRFPAHDITTIDEPSGERDFVEDTEEESDSDDDVGAGRGGDDVASAHARRLYADYQKWESSAQDEDGGRGAGDGGGIPTGAGIDDSDDDGDDQSGDDAGEEFVHRKDAKRAAQRPAGDKRKGRGAGAGEGGGGGERYEAVPERVRYILAFQERTSRVPGQVVRYAYDSEPLWPCKPWPSAAQTHRGRPPPRGRRGGAPSSGIPAIPPGVTWPVPPCPGCGSPRVFELQLMPQALSVLRVEDHTAEAIAATMQTGYAGGGGASSGVPVPATSPAAPPDASAPPVSASSLLETTGLQPRSLEELHGGGLDFGTVLVYVCPASCGASDTEVAVVVPSDD